MPRPTTKSQQAEAVERILLALRRDYLSSIHAPELPRIDPADWASWHLRETAARIAESKRQASKTDPPPGLFPTSDRLAALDEAVSKLATELGVKRQRGQDRWRMFKRLEHDYARLKLQKFAHELSKRVEQVPVPPLTQLSKRLVTGKLAPDEQRRLVELYVLLGGHPRQLPIAVEPPVAKKAIDWSHYESELKRLVSPSFNQAIPQQTALMSQGYARLAFSDVLAQQHNWRTTYAQALAPCVTWLHGLLVEEIDARLRIPLHGSVWRPDFFRGHLRRVAVNQRQRKHRRGEKASKNS